MQRGVWLVMLMVLSTVAFAEQECKELPLELDAVDGQEMTFLNPFCPNCPDALAVLYPSSGRVNVSVSNDRFSVEAPQGSSFYFLDTLYEYWGAPGKVTVLVVENGYDASVDGANVVAFAPQPSALQTCNSGVGIGVGKRPEQTGGLQEPEEIPPEPSLDQKDQAKPQPEKEPQVMEVSAYPPRDIPVVQNEGISITKAKAFDGTKTTYSIVVEAERNMDILELTETLPRDVEVVSIDGTFERNGRVLKATYKNVAKGDEKAERYVIQGDVEIDPKTDVQTKEERAHFPTIILLVLLLIILLLTFRFILDHKKEMNALDRAPILRYFAAFVRVLMAAHGTIAIIVLAPLTFFLTPVLPLLQTNYVLLVVVVLAGAGYIQLRRVVLQR